MSTKIVARVALATVLLFPIANVVATSAAAEPPTMPCAGEWEIVDCESSKESCMADHVQTGSFGEQYVPPDAVASCMNAYWECRGIQ